MEWNCPDDHERLTVQTSSLTCPGCGREYPIVDGIPVFTRDGRGNNGAQQTSPVLNELWESMQAKTASQAAAEMCGKHGCTRSMYNADWKFFLPAATEGTTLELGAGFGEDSVDLGGPAGTSILVVPNVLNARIVSKHLGERSDRDWPVAVLTDLTRLPLADGSVQSVSLEDVAAAGFGLSDAGLRAVANEWRRVLAPNGVVFIGVSNGLHRLPGLKRLRTVLRARPRAESLNRLVKRSVVRRAGRGLSPWRTIRTMAQLGFGAPVVYAPLPDENDIQVVIPVADKCVVRYFLNNLVRKNSRIVRIALRLCNITVTLGLFRRLVPYYYLIFRTGSS